MINSSSPPPPPPTIVEGQKKIRKKEGEEDNEVIIKELLERVGKLEAIIQNLVSWATLNFGFSSGGGGSGGGGQGIQKFLDKEHEPGGDKGQRQTLLEGYARGGVGSSGGEDDKLIEDGHLLQPDAVKVEPLEFQEFGAGGQSDCEPLIVNGINSELYHPRKPRRNGQGAVNNDTNDEDNDDSSDSDYNPSNYEMEENYANSEPENDIKSKSPKTKCIIATTTILSKDVAESLLPNPYIRLGPNKLIRSRINKSNIKLRPLPRPRPQPPVPPAKKKKNTTKQFSCSTKKGTRGSPRFKCDYEECKYFTNFKRKYLEHYRKHTGERPFLCSTCGKGFRGKQYLDSHIKSHANDGNFTCQVCKAEFSNQRILQKHFNESHKDLRRQCDICRAIFSTKNSLRFHIKLMHDETLKKTICGICGHGFKCNSAYKTHMGLHEKPNYKPRGPRLVAPASTNPPLDGELDVDKVYEAAPKIVCREEGCEGKKFITEHVLQIHTRKHHLTPEQRKVACNICHSVFKDLDTLKRHMKAVHITERRFVCSICGQAFKTGQHLVRHERGHANPNWKPRANCKSKKYEKPNNMNEDA